jgi:copper resistance protein B
MTLKSTFSVALGLVLCAASITTVQAQSEAHDAHDTKLNSFVLFDQLEARVGSGTNDVSWDRKGWIGGDRNRFWFRVEGAAGKDGVDHAEAHALFGRAFSRWWEVVGGVRQDVEPGPRRTWAAVGVQGLAPYWFDVEATAYVSTHGDTSLRLEAEYELLLSRRAVLQPLVEVNLYANGSGDSVVRNVSNTEAGLRLRYEIRRELAPYVGAMWRWSAQDVQGARTEGDGARLVIGLRWWY